MAYELRPSEPLVVISYRDTWYRPFQMGHERLHILHVLRRLIVHLLRKPDHK